MQLASASEHHAKLRFKEIRIRSSVEDARELESSVRLVIGDGGPGSFCDLRVTCFLFENNRNRMLIDITASMKLIEDSDLRLEDFPVDQTMSDVKAFCPTITAGTRYRITRDEKLDTIVERSLEVELRVLEEELNIKQLEGYDFDETGDYVADSIGLLLAIYQAARNLPVEA